MSAAPDRTSRSDGGTGAAPGAGTVDRSGTRGRGAGRPRAAQGAALAASLASGSFSTPYSYGLTARVTSHLTRRSNRYRVASATFLVNVFKSQDPVVHEIVNVHISYSGNGL